MLPKRMVVNCLTFTTDIAESDAITLNSFNSLTYVTICGVVEYSLHTDESIFDLILCFVKGD